jgi:hypothetical protein
MDERTRAELDLLRNSSPPAFFGQTLLRSLPAVVWSAGLLLLWSVVLNFALPMFGVGGSFRRTLAVTANAALVRPLGSFCRGAVMLATGNLMVRTNLLLVLPSDAPALLRAFGSYVDVFTLWEVALVAVGLRVAFGVDTRKTAAVAFGAWLVYALLLAAVSSVLGIAELF